MPVPVPLPKSLKPKFFILPDLVGHCNFPLTYHPHGDAVAAASVAWLAGNCPEVSCSPRACTALAGLRAGELTAMCYPTCNTERLRVVSDFMYYLFRLDDISDGMVRRGTEELAGAVMNALWFPDRYMPTGDEAAWSSDEEDGKPSATERAEEEITAAKLARE